MIDKFAHAARWMSQARQARIDRRCVRHLDRHILKDIGLLHLCEPPNHAIRSGYDYREAPVA